MLIYCIYVGSSYFFILDSDLGKIAFHESKESKESKSESGLHRLCRFLFVK